MISAGKINSLKFFFQANQPSVALSNPISAWVTEMGPLRTIFLGVLVWQTPEMELSRLPFKETSPEQAQPCVWGIPSLRKPLPHQQLPFWGRKQTSWRHSSDHCRKQRNVWGWGAQSPGEALIAAFEKCFGAMPAWDSQFHCHRDRMCSMGLWKPQAKPSFC